MPRAARALGDGAVHDLGRIDAGLRVRSAGEVDEERASRRVLNTPAPPLPEELAAVAPACEARAESLLRGRMLARVVWRHRIER